MKRNADGLLFAVDLLGTFVFAVEGAMAAIKGNLDFFGVLVLSFVTASGGGIIRDLLIGAVPPTSIRDRRYAVAAGAGAMLVFFLHRAVGQIPDVVMVTLDAAGLGLFAVSGTVKALDNEIDPFMAVFMGTITGVGGGTVRDVLLTRVPAILQVDVYAVAAMAGAAIVAAGIVAGGSRARMMVLGGSVCFGLRMVAYWQHWNLPTATGL